MDIGRELRQNGIEWAIDVVTIEVPSQIEGRPPHKAQRYRVRFADWNSSKENWCSAVPATLEVLYQSTTSPDSPDGLEVLLARAMRDLIPEHPVRRAYLDHHGNVPVVVLDNALGESLGECIHTQMRKCLDGPDSIIQWQGVHHLLAEDWSQMLELIREEVGKVQRLAKSRNRLPRRREIGMAIRCAMVERMEEVHNRGACEANRYKRPKRTHLQEFALAAFAAACKTTNTIDWVWGWTSYLCEEPKEAAQDGRASETGAQSAAAAAA